MKQGLVAAAGLAGAAAASACCILPLALVSLGVGGAWMSTLTALTPYQPLFLALALISLGLGFWLVYRPAQKACASTVGTASGLGRLLRKVPWVKATLWLGTALAALSVGADYGARLFL